jgi:hypothetical protein
MKLIKNLAAALLLASVLSVSAYAGDLQTPGAAPPPPPNSVAATESTEETEAPVPPEDDELMIDALLALLSLF